MAVRDRNDEPAVGLEHTADLGQRFFNGRNVFQAVMANHQVESRCLKWDPFTGAKHAIIRARGQGRSGLECRKVFIQRYGRTS